MAIGEIKTGVTTSLKTSATNAAVAATKAMATEAAKVANATSTDEQVVYAVIGYPVLTCFSEEGVRIKFQGGKYILDKESLQFKDIVEALDYQIKRGKVKKI